MADVELMRPPRAAIRTSRRGAYELPAVAGARFGVVRFGQSYEEGLMGFPALSGQAHGNLRVENGTDPGAPPLGLVPLEPRANSEELLVGFTHQIARELGLTGMIAHVRPLGGSSIVSHIPGTPLFDQQAQLMTDAAGLLAPAPFVYVAAGCNIGFSDETGNMPRADETPAMDWPTYEAHLLSIIAGYRAEATARTGQTHAFPLFIDQLGFWQLDPGPAIAAGYSLELLELGLSNPDVVCCGPVHPYAVGPDNLHLTAEGYRAKAEHDGAVAGVVLGRGIRFRPLYAIAARAVGTRVTLSYFVPAVAYSGHAEGSWLVLDEAAAAWRSPPADNVTHGFRYVPPVAGAARAVVGVSLGAEIVGGVAEVHVDLDGAPEASGQIGVADFGAAPPNGPVCNLRDRWNVTTEGGQPAWNFAATQRIAIAF